MVKLNGSVNKEELLMTNKEIYTNAFKEAFNVDEPELSELKYQGIKAWDSAGHMILMSIIEEGFDIMFETDDIIDFSSFEKGKEILDKYGVTVE
jgi:acyl carrier protein